MIVKTGEQGEHCKKISQEMAKLRRKLKWLHFFLGHGVVSGYFTSVKLLARGLLPDIHVGWVHLNARG